MLTDGVDKHKLGMNFSGGFCAERIEIPPKYTKTVLCLEVATSRHKMKWDKVVLGTKPFNANMHPAQNPMIPALSRHKIICDICGTQPNKSFSEPAHLRGSGILHL